MASPIDWTSAKRLLVALTDDLKPSPTTSATALLAARKELAIAIMDGQDDFEHRLLYNPARVTLTPVRWAPYHAAQPTGTPTSGQRVVRRTIGLPTKGVNLDNFPENKMFGRKPTLTHGPFIDSVGREVYFDVFLPKPARAFSFPGDIPVVFMYTTAPASNTSPFSVALGKGTVWMRADLFTRASPQEVQAPPDVFFGLAIESGTVTTPPVPNAPKTVTLKLSNPATTSLLFSITPVLEVSFAFNVISAELWRGTVTFIGKGSATVLGSAFTIQQGPPLAVTYDFPNGRLNFSMKADNTTFTPASSISEIVDMTGTSTVAAVSWSVLAKNVINPSLQYEMPNAGGFVFSLLGEGTIGMLGQNLLVLTGASTLVVDSESIVIISQSTRMTLRSRTLTLGQTSADSAKRKSSLTLRQPGQTRSYYMAAASGAESWTLLMNMAIALDQPRTVNGDRVPIMCQNGNDNPWSSLTCFQDPTSNGLTLNVQASNNRRGIISSGPIAYALKNLLLKADVPDTIDMSGKFASGWLVSGAITMVSVLRYTLPFLPDPYVSNFEPVPDASVEKNGFGYLTMTYPWTADIVGELEVGLMTILAIPARTIERHTDPSSLDDPVLAQIQTFYDKAVGVLPGGSSFQQQEVMSGIVPDMGLGQLVHLPDGPLLPDAATRFHPPTLLDISSSSSQFGVVFGTSFNIGRTDSTFHPPNLNTSFAAVEEFDISDLILKSSASNVHVMTLPAVQWEPIVEFQPPHEVYNLPYSGPTTQIAIQDGAPPAPSVRLVPIAPADAIDGMLESYHSTSQVSIGARTSLPFGMVALAKLTNKVPLTRIPAQMGKIDFLLGDDEGPKTKLKTPKLQPTHQLWFKPPGRFRPLDPRPRPAPTAPALTLKASEDESFPGRTLILNMNVGPLIPTPPPPQPPPAPGTRAGIFDPATTKFNSDMSTKVPLSRFDISGYGTSIFSDWKRVLGTDPRGPSTGITNVLLNVLTGRTSREVIELATVMGPFAVTVVKVIEIRRLNSGIVVRQEKEWNAVGPGRYFYKNAAISTHPGIIMGVTDVRNITELGRPGSLPGVKLNVGQVRFDCNVEILDGRVKRSVPGVQLDGCVFVKGDNGEDLSDPVNGVGWYMATIQQLNLGGRIDAVVRIGTSGQKKRLTSIAVKPTADPASGKQVAAVAAMGSPIFPGSGQWSFARLQSDDTAKQAQPVDLAKGVPLVKSGAHDLPNLLSLATPYLFRDPQDLLSAFPSTAYSIIHGAASHRLMFASPEIPFVQEAKAGIQAAQVWVADSLALGKSASIFPSLDVCLQGFPDMPNPPKQLLEVVQDAGYKFEIQHLQLPDGERLIQSAAGAQTVAQAINTGQELLADGRELVDHRNDILAAKTSLNVAVNTLDNISKLDVTNLHMITRTVNEATAAVKDVSRTIGRLSSDVQKVGGLLGLDPDAPQMPPGIAEAVKEVKHVFGSALSKVQKAISFLENLSFLPHFKVSMTNEWGMILSTSMNKDDLMALVGTPGNAPLGEIIESFDFLISATLSLAAFLLKMHVGVTIKIPTGVGPIVALGTGAFDVAVGTSGVQVLLELGFGIGVDLSVGPFSASASYTQSQSILVTDGAFALGITAIMRAHVDLVVASADLYLEAKLLVVGGTCTPNPPNPPHSQHGGTTIWAYARVKIALHVSIFLICNIGYEEEAHWDSNLNGGLCQLNDMADLLPGQGGALMLEG